MRKLLAGMTVLAALFVAMPAVAQAKMTKLTLRTAAGVLTPGAELEAVRKGGGGLSLDSSVGEAACATDGLMLSLAGNEAAKDPATVTSGFFEGCTSSFFGPIELATAHHPWAVSLSSRGIARVNDGGAGRPTIVETLGPYYNHAKCVYESSKLVASFEPGPAGEPAPLTLTFVHEPKANVFKANRHESPVPCPREAKLAASLEVLSGGEQVLAEL